MRNVLRRVALGVLGTGMIVTMAAGVTTVAASAAGAASLHLTPVKTATLDWPKVSEGAHGNRVITIQYLLNQRGYPVPVTGNFLSLTKAQVIAFQKANHLTKDKPGVVGDQTWPALVVVDLHKDQAGVTDAVKAVQSYLRNAYGFTNLAVDGKFGSATEAAVKDFQAHHGVSPADGRVSLKTWYALVKDALLKKP